MTERSPAYQWYPRDFLSSSFVARLSPEQECAYRRLLDYQWMDGSIPSTPEALAPLCRLSVAKMRTAWSALSIKFAPLPGHEGRLVNPRLEEERAVQAAWREKSAKGGRESARIRAAARSKLEPEKARVVEPPLANGSNQSPTPLPQSSVLCSQSSQATPPPAASGDDTKANGHRKKPAGEHADFIAWWMTEYEATQGTPYCFQAGKDGAAASKVLKLLGLAEAEARAASWLRSTDTWVAGTDRGLALFVSKVNMPSLRGIEPVLGRDVRVGQAAPAPHSAFSETGRIDL